MELVKFEAGKAIVALEPEDCAALGSLCSLAYETLDDPPKQIQTRTYAAAFQALGVASASLGFIPSDGNGKGWREYMGELDLNGVTATAGPVQTDSKG